MKKYCLFAGILIFSIFLNSCSDGRNGEKVFSGESETIKNIALKREQELLWTRELESVRLLIDTKKNQAVSESVKLTPEVIVCAPTAKNPIYPYLNDFGSLDTTGLSKELRIFLDESCSFISSWKIESLAVSENAIFSSILFKYDVENLWAKEFNDNFPAIEEKTKIFTSWLYGEPFIDGSEVQIPIRFYSLCGTIDVSFCVSTEPSFKIDSIQIVKWIKK